MLVSILVLVTLLVALISSNAMPPVIANVRGKKYDVNAETVQEFCGQVEALTGIPADQQSVLFRGKVFNTNDKLSDVGVQPGDILNVVKGRRGVTPTSNVKSDVKMDVDDITSSVADDDSNIPLPGNLEEQLKNMSPEELQKKAMQAMDSLLDSDFLDEYFNNEEKLEAARLQMLGNLDQYANVAPGFKDQAAEVASSPEKWKEAMTRAKEQLLQLKKERDTLRSNGQFPGNDSSVDDLGDSDDN